MEKLIWNRLNYFYCLIFLILLPGAPSKAGESLEGLLPLLCVPKDYDVLSKKLEDLKLAHADIAKDLLATPVMLEIDMATAPMGTAQLDFPRKDYLKGDGYHIAKFNRIHCEGELNDNYTHAKGSCLGKTGANTLELKFDSSIVQNRGGDLSFPATMSVELAHRKIHTKNYPFQCKMMAPWGC